MKRAQIKACIALPQENTYFSVIKLHLKLHARTQSAYGDRRQQILCGPVHPM